MSVDFWLCVICHATNAARPGVFRCDVCGSFDSKQVFTDDPKSWPVLWWITNDGKAKRPSWNQWAVGIARAVRARGDCTRDQVGAVLFDQRTHQVHAVGYNGTTPGQPGCLAGFCPRGRLTHAELPPGAGSYASCIATHAEANCLKWSRRWWRGKWWYKHKALVVTRAPCQDCRVLMVGYGVRTVLVDPQRGM